MLSTQHHHQYPTEYDNQLCTHMCVFVCVENFTLSVPTIYVSACHDGSNYNCIQSPVAFRSRNGQYRLTYTLWNRTRMGLLCLH
jgi:hypothetical protein